MKPAAFDYVRADTRRQVVELLAEYGQEARIIAGGQSLMAVLNMRLAQPKLLIDINHVAELAYIELRKDCLAVGAGVRQAQLLARSTLMDEVPLLALAMPWIGHFQTRNRGTVCGSVAHADPSAELPLCLVTLGGEIVLESKKGKRIVKAADFFQGILTTDKRADELVVEVRFPLKREGITYRFREIAMRHGDFASTVEQRSAKKRLGTGFGFRRAGRQCRIRRGFFEVKNVLRDGMRVFRRQLRDAQADRQHRARRCAMSFGDLARQVGDQLVFIPGMFRRGHSAQGRGRPAINDTTVEQLAAFLPANQIQRRMAGRAVPGAFDQIASTVPER